MAEILVCDNEEASLSFLGEALESHHQITKATDGQEGFELFRSRHFNIVITELNMPIMSGLELIFEIRSTRINIGIIAVSAFLSYKAIRAITLDIGADFCLTKPVDIAMLEESIALIRLHHRSASDVNIIEPPAIAKGR